jgi:NAD(P)-dependent dehydrogenase (short-subunit alcohol dehydrogenase family)
MSRETSLPTVLVTGANRGIGFEFAKSYAADGWRVHACARNVERAREVRCMEGDVVCHRLDVTNGLKVAGLARELAAEPIDVLINNAGIYGPRTGFGETDYDEWLEVLKVNTLAPLRMVERFVDLIDKSQHKTVVNISSRMGSIGENTSGGAYIYRSSKAALNMVTKSLANDLAGRGFKVISFHPGWVQTDMGGESAAIGAAESVKGMRAVIAGLKAGDSGKFFNFDGSPIVW